MASGVVGRALIMAAGLAVGWSELVLLGHPFGVADTRWWRCRTA
jgi:hypothetical protein